MAEQADKLAMIGQLPHTGKTDAQVAAEWRELVQDVYAQALVRHLDRDEIESIIPDELANYFHIEEYGEAFAVRIMRKSAGIGILQEICDCDCAKMHEVRDAELAEAETVLDAEE